MRFRSLFGRECGKNQIFKQLFWQRYSVCNIKQYIADGFWMVDVSLMDSIYFTKKA